MGNLRGRLHKVFGFESLRIELKKTLLEIRLFKYIEVYPFYYSLLFSIILYYSLLKHLKEIRVLRVYLAIKFSNEINELNLVLRIICYFVVVNFAILFSGVRRRKGKRNTKTFIKIFCTVAIQVALNPLYFAVLMKRNKVKTRKTTWREIR